MIPTPYLELNDVLERFVSGIQQRLGGTFLGAYLQGSFAVGGFDPHSDVDFVIVLNDELRSGQVDRLQVLHDQVYRLDSEWAKHLEGSYFPKEILRDSSHRGEELWYLDHGARTLIRSAHCNTNLVRWVIREKGIPLAGPPPGTLVDPIPMAMLRAEVYNTLTTWGEEILEDPDPYRNRYYQGFIVLNFSRMLHDLHRGYPGSKQEGATWAKGALDPSWSDLIDGAWDGRPDPATKVRLPADPEAFRRTMQFVQYIMAESRRFMAVRD